MAFNREYMPLGYNDLDLKGNPGKSFSELPVYTKFKGLTDRLLKELADSEHAIKRNNKAEITTIFLYNDGTNPTNQSTNKPQLWKSYFKKLESLSKLQVNSK